MRDWFSIHNQRPSCLNSLRKDESRGDAAPLECGWMGGSSSICALAQNQIGCTVWTLGFLEHAYILATVIEFFCYDGLAWQTMAVLTQRLVPPHSCLNAKGRCRTSNFTRLVQLSPICMLTTIYEVLVPTYTQRPDPGALTRGTLGKLL